jgi:uncharacterized delta-60 repeat protein
MKQFWITILFSLFTVFSFAAPGDLDSTFGLGGIVIENFSNTSNTLGMDGVIQKSGNIVVAGQSYESISASQIALARFTPAGTLDSTFGTGGWTITDFGYDNIWANAAAQQSDGKIIVTGPLFDAKRHDFFVARFTMDGKIDKDFGKKGIVLIDFGKTDDRSWDVAIQSDEKIVVVGTTYIGSNQNMALARLDQTGKLDPTFGTKGLVQTDFNGLQDWAETVAINSDKQIVVGGFAQLNSSNHAFAAARYNATGALDPSFGSGGKVTTDFGPNYDVGTTIALQPDGKVVLTGLAQPTSGVFAFARYHTNGQLDTQHTEDYTASAWEASYGLEIAANGRLILGGRSETNFNVSTASFALSCYHSNGTLDTAFGAAGWVITNIGPDYESSRNLKLQPDNKIVMIGFSLQGDGRYYLVLTRHHGCG